jgi:TolB-like protein/predicted Ser/Thr protein kinase
MMDRARWSRVQELFHRAVDLSPGERTRFLEEACAGDAALLANVRAMIAEDSRAESLLDHDVAQLAGRMLDEPAALDQVGRYRILRLLGEGGMGVVYLARREDLGNLVALKVLREGWHSPRRRRFEAEQRTLASLNHPSIARLYDAGSLADGTPWFVMEYVDGLPLNQYCRRQESSIPDRLRLFREVCEAVRHAHEQSIIHRDLKPSNILVRNDGAVRLLDFGIAKHLSSAPLQADQTRTGLRLMTPAYAAPEQVRGGDATKQTDVYALGVILYELLAGRLPFDLSAKTPAEAASTIATEEPQRPSAAAGASARLSSDLDALCLTAMEKDPRRRYASVDALIRDLDHYRNHEPLDARRHWLGYAAGKFASRHWRPIAASATLAAVLILAGLALRFQQRTPAPLTQVKAVAVLPLSNAGADHSVDYLGVALSEEIARTLSYARWLTVRSYHASRNYSDPRKAARDLRASKAVIGSFQKIGDRLEVTLEADDVEGDGPIRLLWQDSFNVAAGDTLDLQAAVASRILHAVGPLVGEAEYSWNSRLLRGEFAYESRTRPKNQEAYDLYLRATAMPDTPAARTLIERSLQLDPGYAPAWIALNQLCTGDNWYGKGGQDTLQCENTALEHASKLDPDNVWIADSVVVHDVETGHLVEAYRSGEELARRRPDHPTAHFYLAYALRYAGLLDLAERECNTAIRLDPQDNGLRSCANSFLLAGDYQRAKDFLRLDRGSEFERAISMDVALREGKPLEALAAEPEAAPSWAGFPALTAYLKHRPAKEIAGLVRATEPVHDPEMNYFAAAHLAYIGETEAALNLLRAAVAGGYCSYPAVDSDPLLAPLRPSANFAEIRSLAKECRERFVRAANPSLP